MPVGGYKIRNPEGIHFLTFAVLAGNTPSLPRESFRVGAEFTSSIFRKPTWPAAPKPLVAD